MSGLGWRICERHLGRATPNLAGKTAILLGIQQSGGWIRAMLLNFFYFCEWSVDGEKLLFGR
jgi:hypothetical protein